MKKSWKQIAKELQELHGFVSSDKREMKIPDHHKRPTQADPYGSKIYDADGQELSNWIKITKDNVHELKQYDVIRFHDGYGWGVLSLTPFNIERGFVPTGVHNDVAFLLTLNSVNLHLYLKKKKYNKNNTKMAKIEMDVSEYETMKENKSLLEASLDNERGLRKEIKKLTEEKVQALEDAKMQVVKISKSERRDFLLEKRAPSDVWPQLLRLLNVDYRTLPPIPEYIDLDHIRNVFFERTTSMSVPSEPEITTIGLDEYKKELREDIEREIKASQLRKLEKADGIITKNAELLVENDKVTKENGTLIKMNKKLTKISEELEQETEETKESSKKHQLFSQKYEVIETIMSNGYGFFNKSEKLDDILKIIQTKN